MSDRGPNPAQTSAERSALACLACRTAKQKCDGDVPTSLIAFSRGASEGTRAQADQVLADQPCSRCRRLRSQCWWQPSHRSGRPRKRARDAAPSAISTGNDTADPSTTTAAAAAADEMMSTALSTSDFFDLLNDPAFLLDSTVETPTMSTLGRSPSTLLAPRLAVTTPGIAAAKQTPQQQLATMRARLARGAAMPRRDELDEGRSGATGECSSLIATSIDSFFGGFAKAVPVLGSRTDYECYLNQLLPRHSRSKRVLTFAVATLGASTRHGSSSQAATDIRARSQEALRHAEAFVPLDSVQSVVDTLAMVQARLLLAYDQYGCNEIAQASAHLQQASLLALQLLLNTLDQPGSALSSLLQQQSAMNHALDGVGSVSSGEFLLEMSRRTWWELFLFDTMLHVTTSGKVAQAFDSEALPVAVHTPVDIGCDRGMPQCAQAYDIRIRATALIRECTKTPARGQDPDLDRLKAIDTMLSNLIVTAQRLWAGATSVLTADRSRGSNCGLESSAGGRIHDGQWANETKAEVLFAAILMLHAGRIHAHRQAWFNDLSLDLSSCSFQQESLSPDDVHTPHLASTSTRQRAPGMCEQDLQAMLPLSVARIISSSDAIMRQIRADQRRSTSTQFASAAQNLPSTAMMPVHWPFFGCCNMVAAFGYVVAVAAGGSGETHLQFDAEHGEMCVDDFSPMAECTAPGDATRAGGDGLAALHSSTPDLWQASWSTQAAARRGPDSAYSPNIASAVWKTRLALSNIGLAEATLVEYSQMWPICESFRQEISNCRAAIDFSGPTGLGAP